MNEEEIAAYNAVKELLEKRPGQWPEHTRIGDALREFVSDCELRGAKKS